MSTVVGGGVNEVDNALATNTKLSFPIDVKMDVFGNLYIADYHDHVVRMLNATTGIVSIFAGSPASNTFAPDTSDAREASLKAPCGL